ncbi:MAG: ABC transporter ATP-binding protein [Burkholderiales bacterium]|nr:ABC transporter ATP-binding protein [Burkholderiales bacterium]
MAEARLPGVSVEVQDLARRFARGADRRVAGVNGINFTAQPGEFMTLLGPSGCGKTTTLRMIAGFESPDAGRVLIGGEDVSRTPVYRRNIGFVFQSYALFPHLTVFENVAYALRVQKMAEREIGARVAATLETVGLPGYETRHPAQLSGGEQQRVAVARAVVMRPRVLLFDEPLSNLDAKLRVQMREELRRLQKDLAITTIYVTHDQEEAMAVSDTIVVMEAGEIAQVGTAEDLYCTPASEFVARFIGKTNTLPARVEGTRPGIVDLRVLDRSLAVASELPWSVGEECTLVVRPEALMIEAEASGAVEAVVLDRTFLGEKAEYALAAGDLRLQAVVYNDARRTGFPIGSRVGLRWKPDNAHLIKPAPRSS